MLKTPMHATYLKVSEQDKGKMRARRDRGYHGQQQLEGKQSHTQTYIYVKNQPPMVLPSISIRCPRHCPNQRSGDKRDKETRSLSKRGEGASSIHRSIQVKLWLRILRGFERSRNAVLMPDDAW